MFRQETRRHIENALHSILAADGVLPDLHAGDPRASQENIHLLATKLADCLWSQGYELAMRSSLGMPSRPAPDPTALYYEGT